MSRFYGDPVTPERLSTHEAVVSRFASVVYALIAHVQAHAGLPLAHVNAYSGRDGERWQMQIVDPVLLRGDVPKLIAWARSLHATEFVARGVGAGMVHLHIHGWLDGIPVDVWTGCDALTGSRWGDSEGGEETIAVDDLAAAVEVAGHNSQLGFALREVQSRETAPVKAGPEALASVES